jgi:hypothetical protein
VGPDGDCDRATLTLTLTNRADVQNEYVARLKLSPAVMVSGLRLDINGEKVDGKIFEQKTALWVYRQIRDRQRRDPALLRYTADNEVELRVFPLEKNQTRVVEVEFIYPNFSYASVLLNGSDILPPAVRTGYWAPLTATRFSDRQQMLTLMVTPVSLGQYTTRTPYHHFIIERSAATAQQTAAELLEKIRAADRDRPLENCKITLANFESELMTPLPVPVASLTVAQLEKMLRKFPPRGGFLEEKVLREEAAAYENSLRRDDPQTFKIFPRYTLIVSGATRAVPLEDDGISLNYAPSASIVSVFADGERAHSLIKPGRAFVAADVGLEIFDGEKFAPVTVSAVTNTTYRRGAALFALQDELDRHPARAEKLLPRLVKLSRESGILAPATAYIIVEQSVHWKILSEKERQKLAANQALELEDPDTVPEPATLWLLAAGLLLLAMLHCYRRQRAA